MNTIYQRIEMLMHQHRLSRKDFAETIGISTGNLGDWKRGKSLPGASALIKIAEHFDVSLDWLMRGKRPNQVGEPNQGYFFEDKWQLDFQIHEKWNELSEEEQQFVKDYVEFAVYRKNSMNTRGYPNE